MKTKNSEITMHAREALKGKWGIAIGAQIVYFVLLLLTRALPGIGFAIDGPLALGMAIFTLSISRNNNPQIEQLFDGFKRFVVALIAWVLMMVYIIAWALLLIIPGIVAALSYSLVFYIIADDNSITAVEALKRSKKMMMGNKWKMFRLGFRFFGWAILACLTLGVGFLWLIPYMNVSFAKFYEEVKGEVMAA